MTGAFADNAAVDGDVAVNSFRQNAQRAGGDHKRSVRRDSPSSAPITGNARSWRRRTAIARRLKPPRINSPVPSASAPTRHHHSNASGGSAGAVLDLIARPESHGNYNPLFGDPGQQRVRLTGMTLEQVRQSTVWAGLPKDASNQSDYEGQAGNQAGNRALVSRTSVLQGLGASRRSHDGSRADADKSYR